MCTHVSHKFKYSSTCAFSSMTSKSILNYTFIYFGGRGCQACASVYCRGLGTACSCHFFPSTLQIPRIGHRLSDLVTGTWAHWPAHTLVLKWTKDLTHTSQKNINTLMKIKIGFVGWNTLIINSSTKIWIMITQNITAIPVSRWN